MTIPHITLTQQYPAISRRISRRNHREFLLLFARLSYIKQPKEPGGVRKSATDPTSEFVFGDPARGNVKEASSSSEDEELQAAAERGWTRTRPASYTRSLRAGGESNEGLVARGQASPQTAWAI